MHMYALTLQRSAAINCVAYGNFSGPKLHEIVVAHGKSIELLRPDAAGKVQSLCHMECFGLVRSMVTFRLPGASVDYLVLGSDSGRVSVLEFVKERNQFERLHLETFGKSGCRRAVAGQHLAADPKGRAIMIAAVEKQKLVYIFNRDGASKLTISSPLEAHKANTINFSIVAVDVGYDNPIFACIELDYSDADQDDTGEAAVEYNKMLTFYELDLGLNHVVRKASEPIDPASNMLIPVPGDTDGPSGVLVCAENKIAYKKPDHEDVVTLIPRRSGMPLEQPLLITAFTMLKQKDSFFILLQSELGDLYRLTLTYEGEEVSEIHIDYFDTVPVAQALVILKTGFLFVASEFANHRLYQFLSIKGSDEADIIPMQIEIEGESIEIPHFAPRPLKNLLLVDELESLSPILDMRITDLAGEETPQMYALCGRGPRSSLRTLRHGLAVAEMAVSELPSNPLAVWTVKANNKELADKYIVVTFTNATIVLSIGETVEEVTDSGFLATDRTLSVSLLGDDMLLQVHPGGLRTVRSDKRISQFTPPGKGTICKVAVTQTQVVIAMIDNSIIYFELDAVGQLQERAKPEMGGGQIGALDLAPLSDGSKKGRFLAVGVCVDGQWAVRIISLDSGNFMSVVSRQALPAKPETLCIVEMALGAAGEGKSMLLFCGLENGVLMRIGMDAITGQLAPDFRTRFLGARPVKLFKVMVHETAAVLALSSRSWLVYNYQGRYQVTPLSYESLEYGSSFSSEQCPEGLVSVAGNTLRILTIQRLGEVFNQQVFKLAFTPRKMVLLNSAKCFVIIESDHNVDAAAAQAAGSTSLEDQEQDEEEDEEKMAYQIFGVQRAGVGKWASCVRVVDPVEGETKQLIEMWEDEAAVSVCVARFHDRPGEEFVLVGTATSMKLGERNGEGCIHTYSVSGTQLTLLHKTTVDGVPRALCAFQGRVLVGAGKMLRLYDFGRRKLLRKCENRRFPCMIVSIHTQGERIFIGDVAESFFFVKFNRSMNALSIFGDDTTARWVTSACCLDYDTMAGGDKFGNIFICRLPTNVADDTSDDPGGVGSFENSAGDGAMFKIEETAQYYVGETVTSLQKTALSPGGAEAIVYATIGGGVGSLQPFVSRQDVDFFMHLEMHLRGTYGARENKTEAEGGNYDHPSICGRDQLSFRSYYFPVKDVIDGDLCETFLSLDPKKQKTIADDLDRTPGEIAKKLEDMRNRLL